MRISQPLAKILEKLGTPIHAFAPFPGFSTEQAKNLNTLGARFPKVKELHEELLQMHGAKKPMHEVLQALCKKVGKSPNSIPAFDLNALPNEQRVTEVQQGYQAQFNEMLTEATNNLLKQDMPAREPEFN